MCNCIKNICIKNKLDNLIAENNIEKKFLFLDLHQTNVEQYKLTLFCIIIVDKKCILYKLYNIKEIEKINKITNNYKDYYINEIIISNKIENDNYIIKKYINIYGEKNIKIIYEKIKY